MVNYREADSSWTDDGVTVEATESPFTVIPDEPSLGKTYDVRLRTVDASGNNPSLFTDIRHVQHGTNSEILSDALLWTFSLSVSLSLSPLVLSCTLSLSISRVNVQ